MSNLLVPPTSLEKDLDKALECLHSLALKEKGLSETFGKKNFIKKEIDSFLDLVLDITKVQPRDFTMGHDKDGYFRSGFYEVIDEVINGGLDLGPYKSHFKDVYITLGDDLDVIDSDALTFMDHKLLNQLKSTKLL